MHAIPHELLLGVPSSMKVLATTRLLSLRAKVRAALEPLLSQQPVSHDCLGTLIRNRFGNEVHEYLVDPLVGSIYAADTDNFSLEAVPQIHALTSERSLLRAAQRSRSRTTLTGPVFATPRLGMGALVAAVYRDVVERGGSVMVGSPVETITKNPDGSYSVNTPDDLHLADAVVLASPAKASAPLLHELSRGASEALASWSHASVVMLTLAVPREQWPTRLTGSGYLVPKPEQRWVTAASFGSNKWAHWNPDDRSMILRVSLGRDGQDVTDFDDDALVNLALADLAHHLDAHVDPNLVRLTRWPHSFPQYRPHHFAKVQTIESTLAAEAPRITLAGASYRGIGVPACIQQAREAAESVLRNLVPLTQ
jgi:oxygen-dependent protoporphyrinogen oxidase